MSGFLTKSDAIAIVGIGEGVVSTVVKLAANGLRSEGIIALSKAIADGDNPPFDPIPGRPRPLKIQAHSFLHDPMRYSSGYGLSEEEVMRLRVLNKTNPEECRDELSRIVGDTLRRRGSTRSIVVLDTGSPGSVPSGANPTTQTAGRLKAFKREIASNSGVYGSYQFTAHPTGRELTHAFSVDMGWNCFILAQSKELARTVARIVRVKSRNDPSVVDFVYYIASDGRATNGVDINPAINDLRCEPRGDVTPSTRLPSHIKFFDAVRSSSPRGDKSVAALSTTQ